MYSLSLIPCSIEETQEDCGRMFSMPLLFSFFDKVCKEDSLLKAKAAVHFGSTRSNKCPLCVNPLGYTHVDEEYGE